MSRLYYILAPYAPSGNCALFWRIEAHGYTCNLNEAWRVDEVKARSIVDMKRGDQAVPSDEVDSLAIRHFDVQELSKITRPDFNSPRPASTRDRSLPQEGGSA